MDLTIIVIAVAGGYVASIYTWPKIRTVMTGAQSEIKSLEQRIMQIKNKL